MDEFQVGDRVTPVDEELAGDYLTYGEVYTVTRVKQPGGQGRVYLREVVNGRTSEGWFGAGRFRLADAPRKDTPKAGDTVRVVLEGPASVVYPESFRIGFNAVEVDSNYTVSIEILKPAKPSVKDLPRNALVRDTENGEVWRRFSDTPDWWESLHRVQQVKSAVLDQLKWEHLTLKESE